MLKITMGFVGAIALLAGPVAAQMAPPECASVSDANLPADLSGWAKAGAPVTAAAVDSAALPALALGVRTAVRLRLAAEVRLRLPAGQVRTPKAAHAGMVAVFVPAAGIWRVSASKPVWIDMVAGKRRVETAAFGKFAPCTTIHKVLEFSVAAGDHVIQLSGNPGADIDLMLSLKP